MYIYLKKKFTVLFPKLYVIFHARTTGMLTTFSKPCDHEVVKYLAKLLLFLSKYSYSFYETQLKKLRIEVVMYTIFYQT